MTAVGVRVLTSGPGTEGAERQLAQDPISGLMTLRRAIEGPDSLPELIVIDTRPDESHAVLNAMVASDEVWAVVETVPAAIESLPRLLSTTGRIAQQLNNGLSVTWIVPTRFDRRTRTHNGCLEALRRTYPGRVTQPVPASVRVVEAHGARQPLNVFDPLAAPTMAYRVVAEQLGLVARVMNP